MYTHENFLAKIAEAPGEDTVRLTYADWLDEHGSPKPAAFIRAVAQLRATNISDPAVFSRAVNRQIAWLRLNQDYEKPPIEWVQKVFPRYSATAGTMDRLAITHHDIRGSDEARSILEERSRVSSCDDLTGRYGTFLQPASLTAMVCSTGGHNLPIDAVIDAINRHPPGQLFMMHASHDYPRTATEVNDMIDALRVRQELRVLILSNPPRPAVETGHVLKALSQHQFKNLEYLELADRTGLPALGTERDFIHFADSATMPKLRLLSIPSYALTPEVTNALAEATDRFPALEMIQAGARCFDVSQHPARKQQAQEDVERHVRHLNIPGAPEEVIKGLKRGTTVDTLMTPDGLYGVARTRETGID